MMYIITLDVYELDSTPEGEHVVLDVRVRGTW